MGGISIRKWRDHDEPLKTYIRRQANMGGSNGPPVWMPILFDIAELSGPSAIIRGTDNRRSSPLPCQLPPATKPILRYQPNEGGARGVWLGRIAMRDRWAGIISSKRQRGTLVSTPEERTKLAA